MGGGDRGRKIGMKRRTFLGAGTTAALAGLTGAHSGDARAWRIEDSPAFRVRFVRHAESQFDAGRTVDVPGQMLPPKNETGYPLTQLGMEQATALVDRLPDDPVLAVVASPRPCCIQTADAIAFARGTTVQLAAGIEEVAFVRPGMTMTAGDYVASMRVLSGWMQGDLDARTPDGESLNDILERFLPVVQDAIDGHAAQSGQLIFVSQSTVLSAALPFLFDDLPAAWTLTHMLPATGMATGAFVDGRLVCIDWDGALPG